MDTIKKFFSKYKEIIMYLIMGGATTVVNWGTYALCVSYTAMGIMVSNIIAWTAAVIFAYITNKLFVFESYSWKPGFVIREFALFVLARLATGLLEIFGVPFLVNIGLNQTLFGIEGMVSKVTVSIIVVILNYIFSKLVIFKKHPRSDGENN